MRTVHEIFRKIRSRSQHASKGFPKQAFLRILTEPLVALFVLKTGVSVIRILPARKMLWPYKLYEDMVAPALFGRQG